MPCKVKPNNCGVSASSYKLIGSGSSGGDINLREDCEYHHRDVEYFTSLAHFRTVSEMATYNVGPGGLQGSTRVFQIGRKADCGIVFDLNDWTENLIDNAENKVPTSSTDYNYPDAPLAAESTDVPIVTFVNESKFPVYITAAHKHSHHKPFEGVSKNIGVRPNERLQIRFDMDTRAWLVVNQSTM